MSNSKPSAISKCYNVRFRQGGSRVQSTHSIIQLYAGTRPDGEPVYEKIATLVEANEHFVACHSPGFVRGVARGDTLVLLSRQAGRFEVTERRGNLAVRVYSRVPVDAFEAVLTPQVTQLEGRRDIMSARLLVYSVPVVVGFDTVERVFDEAISGNADAQWSYGNVYDDHTGEPLNWWRSLNAGAGPRH